MTGTTLDYDPFSVEAMTDPMPIYARLRDECPVYRLERYDTWALSRFADVWDVYQDFDGFSIVEGPIFVREVVSVAGHGPPPAPPLDPVRSFTELDPPVHAVLRLAVTGPLRPQAVGRLEDQVRALARARLDELVPRGRFDVTTDYAGPVSAGVICRVVGLPPEQAPVLQELVNSSFRRDPGRPGLTEAGLAQRGEVVAMLADFAAHRRKAGADDPAAMVDRLIHATVDGRQLSDTEIADQVRSVVNGGSETVPKVVAGGVHELWRHPDQRRAIAGDTERSAAAFEEMVRYGAPLQWVGRTLNRDMVIGGQPMTAGQRVLLLIASANRDGREFEHPDTFRWDRPMPRHLGFGFGIHFCIGTHVARLEGRVLIEELLARLPDYEIDLSSVERPPSEFQIGFTSMPLVVA